MRSSGYPPAVTNPRPSRRRSALVVILGILACLAITLSATTLWVHQVALNTDRYVTVVSRVAADPEVIQEVSTRLAEQVVEQIEIPRLVKPLLQNWLQEQIATFMGSEAFVEGWAEANRLAHTALIRILRSEAVLPDEPVSISVLPMVVIGLERLQEVGLIPDDVDLPSPESAVEAGETIRRVLSERLGIDLPPDFGQVTLVRPERLELARTFVRIFDLLTVISVLVAIGLVALTVYLARDRRRAVLYLGIGAAIAVLAAIAATGGISGIVARALAEAGAGNTLAALLDAMLGNLATALTVVLILGVVAALAALVVGRSGTPPPMTFAPAGPAPAPSAEAVAAPPATPAAAAPKTAALKPTKKAPAKRPPRKAPTTET